jgi:hypothetical protein
MTSKSPEILRDREKSLEDEFFHREDKRLIERLKELKGVEATRAALFTVPLVEVAWADGTLDAKERRVIVDRAGVARDSTAGALLEAWLDRRPDPKLLAAWTHLVQGMCEQLDADGVARLMAGLLERATAVAAASGGLLAVGSKVSRSEAAMLARLEAAFATKR